MEPLRVLMMREELQRDGLPELEIVRAMDLAHPVAPDQRDDAIATAENGSRGELQRAVRLASLFHRAICGRVVVGRVGGGHGMSDNDTRRGASCRMSSLMRAASRFFPNDLTPLHDE
jgi:hypothetical protein